MFLDDDDAKDGIFLKISSGQCRGGGISFKKNHSRKLIKATVAIAYEKKLKIDHKLIKECLKVCGSVRRRHYAHFLGLIAEKLRKYLFC